MSPKKPYKVSLEAMAMARKLFGGALASQVNLDLANVEAGNLPASIESMAILGAAISEAALRGMLLTRVEGSRVIPDHRAALDACKQAGIALLPARD
jgi:hypothetical protein